MRRTCRQMVVGLAALAAGLVAGCERSTGTPDWVATGRRGMVASDSPYASRAGLEVLRAGGNAIDAAVATSFALGVTRPYSTGLGGGGFLIIRTADGRTVVIDARETAPAAAHRDMFVLAHQQNPDAPPPSQYGPLAVAVPGLLAGLAEAHAEFGARPWAELLAPAIRLAREGYPADAFDQQVARDVLARFERYPQVCAYGQGIIDVHYAGGVPAIGERIRQPRLADLLQRIAEQGADAFYHGHVAEVIVETLRAHGGVMSVEDLAGYQTRRREPIRSTYRGYELITMPPPSSGGVCLAEALNILERFDLPAVQRRDPALARHYVVEAMRQAFADRSRWMGDPDFVDVPTERLISKAYAVDLAGRLRPNAACLMDRCGTAEMIAGEDAGTSHHCTMDAAGNCVTITETINTRFGSMVFVDEVGLVLNNEMDDFAAEPGRPNVYGLVQSERSAVRPHSRPLSSMSPTIVLRDGRPVMLVGAAGGPRIITAVLQTILRVLDFGMSPQEAIAQGRLHHQWLPDRVEFDGVVPDAIKADLRARGHTVSDSPGESAVVQMIVIRDGEMIGVSDPRKGGRPAGLD
jgi:gamma-glutamyltranspeptidase/glutathione hydrolase